jgi:hypothetical protein
MLYREIFAVCSQIHTKHINTLRGQNVELLNIKTVVTYRKQQVLNSELRQYDLSVQHVTRLRNFSINTVLSKRR